MKKVVFGVLFVLISSISFAQTQKIGFVDTETVISIMPEFQDAQAKLSAYAETLITPEMKSKGEAIEQKYQTYSQQEATMGEARKEVAQQEIMKLEKELQGLHQASQTNQKLSQKQNELFGPIEKAAGDMIAEVAKENGFSVVFDIKSSPIVWLDRSNDMMPFIYSKLGLNKPTTGTPQQ